MGLNAKQKEAVEYLDGPLLVLAGPGTGKTQLLSEKVAFILKNTDTNPENLLRLTFTETGASNMRERLKSIIGKEGLKVNIGTYHAFGNYKRPGIRGNLSCYHGIYAVLCIVFSLRASCWSSGIGRRILLCVQRICACQNTCKNMAQSF